MLGEHIPRGYHAGKPIGSVVYCFYKIVTYLYLFIVIYGIYR